MTKLLINLFVKNSDDVKDKNVRKSYGNLGGLVGIACNLILFTIKLVAGVLSGSIAITADAFNNLSDMGSSIVTLLGFKLASKSPDKDHPFGHGRMEYMSAFIVSVVIIVVGFELLTSSIEKIFSPEDIYVNTVTVIVLVLSIIVKFWLGIFNNKLGEIINSTALKATAKDSINDVVATSAVLLTSLISMAFGLNLDGYVGVLVAIFIMYGGFSTAKEMLSPLLGTQPEPELVSEIKSAVLENEAFVGMHDLIIHDYGPGRCFASLHVEVPDTVDVISCHETIDACEKDVIEKTGVELVIHMDPIATECEKRNAIAAVLNEILPMIDSRLHYHDLRIVDGEKRVNIIFDIVKPYEVEISDREMIDSIQAKLSEIDSTFVCVINIDREYL
ncbi:MAG: cation transporter [Clostridia bacterium]|nr:cation transporter [Clostridia bacterium]